MKERRNEISSLKIKVMGYHQNKKGKTVRHPYTVPAEKVSSVLDKYKQDYTDFQNSIIILPKEISKQFQKIGVLSIDKVTDNNLDMYQFALGYIFREKENIPTVDFANSYQIDEIVLDGEKYQYQHLYFTIIPTENSIVADTKCYNTTIQFFINDIYSRLLNAGDYQINDDELEKSVRVHIKGVLDGDYKATLRANFEKLKKIEMTLASPNQAYMENNDDEEQVMDTPFDVVMGAVGALVGEDVVANECPFTTVRIEFNFKETPQGQATVFKAFKRNAKNKLLEINDDKLVRASSIKYYDNEQNEIVRAVKKGITLSKYVEVEAKDFSDSSKMLNEQKQFFIDYKTGQL